LKGNWVKNTEAIVGRGNYFVEKDKRNDVEVLLHNQCCRGNVIIITYSECVPVALVIQHAKRMRSIILSSLACMTVK
jgi:hypothetical protein